MLTDTQLKNLKTPERTTKYFDKGEVPGLHLVHTKTGAKTWRMKYTVAGSEQLLTIGRYPAVSIAEARDAGKVFRAKLERGENPKTKKQEVMTFKKLCKRFLKVHKSKWAGNHYDKQKSRLRRYIYPAYGNLDARAVDSVDVLDTCLKIAEKYPETAARVLRLTGQVMEFGHARRFLDNPGNCHRLAKQLPTAKDTHYVAATTPEELGPFLGCIDRYETPFIQVEIMLKLLPLVFCRPGELRHAKWSQIDWQMGRWGFRLSKGGNAHFAPLSTQAVALLETLHPHTGESEWIFPSPKKPEIPVGESTLNKAIARMGFDYHPHGFRASARTILDEVLEVRVDWIEHQLGHVVKDANGRAYNRTKFIEQRHAMMQQWADYCDSIKTPARRALA